MSKLWNVKMKFRIFWLSFFCHHYVCNVHYTYYTYLCANLVISTDLWFCKLLCNFILPIIITGCILLEVMKWRHFDWSAGVFIRRRMLILHVGGGEKSGYEFLWPSVTSHKLVYTYLEWYRYAMLSYASMLPLRSCQFINAR